MKNNFKKLMSLALVVVMLSSIFCISASAATYTVTLKGGTRKLNNETYTAYLNETLLNLPGNTYTDANGTVYTIDKENHTVTFSTDSSGYVTFPEYFFVMTGHTQSAWGTSATSNGSTTYKDGRRLKITGNKTYHPRFDTVKYVAEFLPGAEGEGEIQTIGNQTYGKAITLLDAIFTRPGFVQVGWSSIENSDVIEFDFGTKFDMYQDVKFYPVWQKVELNITHDVNKIAFGSLCLGYNAPEKQYVNITNVGNADVSLKTLSSTAFDIGIIGSTTIPADGGTLAVSIQPKAGLDVGMYTEALLFDFGNEDANFTVTVKFGVSEHLYVKYVYNNDATYIADGTETAECFSGCGTVSDPRVAEGTKKVYSADNNTADGLMKEYLYHKTVKFVAYGSGMDATPNDNLTKRYRPTEWSVADTAFKGTFDANTTDYTVKYDHGDGNFGTYTLTIKYVEEEKDAEGNWVATENEDVKTFKYSIGPSEKDNQEVVRPNMIVSIIFGLFGYLIDLITSGSLF